MSDKPKISRRSLLRGATIAAPTLLTLHSGSALAQSSNIISTNSLASAEDNTFRCLDASSVARTANPNAYDLGQPALAHVTRITADKEYHKIDFNGGFSTPRVTPQQVCSQGGWYVRKDGHGFGDWSRVSVRPGGLVSATALNSFASGVTFTDV